MTHFSCSEITRQAGISLSGTALNYDNYVLIECPPPWSSYDLETPSIPKSLNALGNEIYGTKAVKNRILLIYNPAYKTENGTRVLVYRKPIGLAKGYVGKEFQVSDLEEVAPLARKCFTEEPWEADSTNRQTRDILICTHGQNDRCCARYGNPLYRQALKQVADLSLSNLRIWQTSHIGGHRFAPIAIAFPEGRYYGQIDSSALSGILTRSGSLQSLHAAYRGWGILPKPVQLLEKELLLEWGWDGLNYPAIGKIVEQKEDSTYYRVELQVQIQETTLIYTANVKLDESKTIELPESCVGDYRETVKSYTISDIEWLLEVEL